MRGQAQGYPQIVDIDVGMMSGILGNPGNLIDEIDRLGKGLKFKGPPDLFPVQFPDRATGPALSLAILPTILAPTMSH